MGFQPDFTWYKERNNAVSHRIVDSSRGSTNMIFPNESDAEYTSDTNELQQFESDGFQVGDDGSINGSGDTYAAFNWRANGGTTSSNTDGTITATVQANTTAGFSIVLYTGTGSNGTFGHGLDSAPEMILLKKRSSSGNWTVGEFNGSGNTKYLQLNTTSDYITSSTIWNNTSPTSTVVSIGTSSGVNTSGVTYVAFCFHSVEGYSKIGTYVGNANADGRFLYLGFRPAWILLKSASSSGDDWFIFDDKRETHNAIGNYFRASQTNAEQSSDVLDFVSNGIKFRASSGAVNDGTTFVYMAFAKQPYRFSNAR